VTFSPRYVLVEALTGALFGVAWWFTLGTGGMLFGSFELQLFRFAIAALFVLDMVVIAFIDLDTKLILHRTTIPMMIVFYAATFALPERQWWDGLLGIAVGYGVPWLIGVVYKLVRGQEGMGLGDGTMLALVGSLLGWRGVVFSLFAGSVVGSIIGVAPLLVGRKRSTSDDAPSLMKTELPFGPYLAIGAVFYLFAEPWIVLHFRLLGT
jgi:leader peptidase (prepilin peptidase)/N-methyltransferase